MKKVTKRSVRLLRPNHISYLSSPTTELLRLALALISKKETLLIAVVIKGMVEDHLRWNMRVRKG